jgi:hypothetical protein
MRGKTSYFITLKTVISPKPSKSPSWAHQTSSFLPWPDKLLKAKGTVSEQAKGLELLTPSTGERQLNQQEKRCCTLRQACVQTSEDNCNSRSSWADHRPVTSHRACNWETTIIPLSTFTRGPSEPMALWVRLFKTGARGHEHRLSRVVPCRDREGKPEGQLLAALTITETEQRGGRDEMEVKSEKHSRQATITNFSVSGNSSHALTLAMSWRRRGDPDTARKRCFFSFLLAQEKFSPYKSASPLPFQCLSLRQWHVRFYL